MLNIVLHEPEIPANTGNIGRTCVAANARLHLIEPLGFRLNEKNLKRAGMDYWKDLDVTTYIDYNDFLEKNPGAKIYMATTKAEKIYTEVKYEPDCYIMFGKESAGIPEEILVNHKEDCIRIPMVGDIRSLNLGNSAAIVPDCYIMFGKESAGIPEEILVNHKEDCIRIPMVGDIRSLNLGNSAAIVLYEALRQNGFEGMNLEGHLHHLKW